MGGWLRLLAPAMSCSHCGALDSWLMFEINTHSTLFVAILAVTVSRISERG